MDLMSEKRSFLLLGCVVLFAAILRILCFGGLIGSDDLFYNFYSFSISEGSYVLEPTNPLISRYGLLLPTALIFKGLGLNEITSIIFPLFCSLLTIIIGFYVGKIVFDFRIGIMAAATLCVIPLDVKYATLLYPDLPTSTFLGLTGSLLIVTKEGGWGNKSTFFALCGLFLGWAYLTKMTTIYFFPFVLGLIIYDGLKGKKVKEGWIYFISSFALILVGEMIFYLVKAGDPFFRIKLIETSHNLSQWSGKCFEGERLIGRLFFDLPDRLLTGYGSFGPLFFFVFSAAVFILFWKKDKRGLYFLGWLSSYAFFFNFGTTSLKSFNLLPISDRFLFPLLLPCSVLLSYFLSEGYTSVVSADMDTYKKWTISVLSASLLFGPVLVFRFCPTILIFSVFISVVGVISVYLYRKNILVSMNVNKRKRVATLLISLFLVVSLLWTVKLKVYGDFERGSYNERMVVEYLGDFRPDKIFTDSRTREVLSYFYGYESDEYLVDFTNVRVDEIVKGFVVINWERLNFLNRWYDYEIPHFAQSPPTTWCKMEEFKNCIIYRIGK